MQAHNNMNNSNRTEVFVYFQDYTLLLKQNSSFYMIPESLLVLFNSMSHHLFLLCGDWNVLFDGSLVNGF